MATGDRTRVEAGAGKGAPPLEEWARRADETLVWHLEDVCRVELAVHAASKVEHARRVARHGASSAAAVEMADRLAASAGRLREMGAEIERIRLPVPARNPAKATIYGRVLTDGLAGFKGAKVVALDAGGKQLATSTTDARGHFQLAVGGAGTAALVARLVARGSDGKVLVEEAKATPRSLGAVVYRELVIRPRQT